MERRVTHADHPQHEGSNRLLRLFGLGTRVSDSVEDCDFRARRQADRAAILNAIAEFLLEHRLSISPANLARAHACVTGTDWRLAEAVVERQRSGDPVSDEWLEEACLSGKDAGTTIGDLERLAQSLDLSVNAFGKTTRDAKLAASSYGKELQRHADAAAGADLRKADDVVASLTEIARTMVERTLALEEQMKRGEEEAASLRQNLAQARRDATIDHLTGLPNRRAFEEEFKTQRLEARRRGEALSLAICDIDLFKQVNDVHGHATGDRIICEVGKALNRIADGCHVARHGGEEFVLLFRSLSIEETVAALDGARERFAERRFVDKVTGQKIGEVTFSGGVVDVFEHHSLGAALRQADKALYRAKQAGRNRIEIAGS